MIFNSGSWPVLRQVPAVCVALGPVVLAYAMGFHAVGEALVLSGLCVALWSLLRSGALSALWLQRQSLLSIKNAARWEFAKAMICAAIGIDGLAAALEGERYTFWVFSRTVLLAWIVVWVAIACLFLVRWFAAYLVSIRP
jgi:hypothetical protein